MNMFVEVKDKQLEKQLTTSEPAYEAPQQFGPLRWFENPHRCASRNCSSQTFCKVDYIPYCMMHALRELNKLCHKLTEKAG